MIGFCHLYAPHQCGENENLSGLLRKSVPKKISQLQWDHIFLNLISYDVRKFAPSVIALGMVIISD
ncbi:hypothetical protein EFT43_02515 [Leuconostoc falkenbergense]|nr:hypothetical protein [Leuconostoc falkenbergense]